MTTVPGSAEVTVPPPRDGPAQEGPLDPDTLGIVESADVAVLTTADRYGEQHVSVLAGADCVVRVLDARRLAWPERSAEPRTAGLANLAEAPEVAVLVVGPGGAGRRALHLNGTARVVPSEQLRAEHPDLPGHDGDVWVVVEVGDAYVLDGDDVPPIAPLPGERAAAPGPPPDRRSPVLAVLALVLVAAGVAVAVVLLGGPTTPAAAPPAPSAPPAAPAPPAGPATLFGRVVDVADPATVVVDVGGAPTRVGVIGLDAATVPACANPASLDFARRTLLGQTVTVVPDPTLPPSPSPRAYLVLESQLSYTDAAIGEGHAPAAGASRYRAVFDREQREARAEGLGMWGPPCTG